MLFVPWRRETDLLGSFATYQQRYTSLELTIKDKEAEYNHNVDAIGNAIESIDSEDQLPDEIASNTEHRNQQDRKEKDKTQPKHGP